MNEFIKLVAEMRETQKHYFKIRTKGALVAAKELEKKVDDKLNENVLKNYLKH